MAKTVPHKPATFKLAKRWGVVIGGELFEIRDNEKSARDYARVLFADQKTYTNALRKKEIIILKVDIRPAKKS